MLERDFIQDVVNISSRFQEGGKSIFFLIRETGYYKRHEEVSEEDLLAGLRENPRALRDWWQIAEDSRAGGWGMFKTDENEFHVAYMEHGEFKEDLTFSDEISSCAHYIKMELEYAREVDGPKKTHQLD